MTQEIIVEEVTEKISTKRKLEEEEEPENPTKIVKVEEKTETKPEEKKIEFIEKKENTETLEDNLICPICFDLFYKCVSVIPCLHNFCSGCYSDWVKNSDTCPQCRDPIVQIGKNHSMDNFVEIFLKQHPDRKRSESEYQEMDQKSIINDEYLKNQKIKRNHNEEDDEDENYSDEEDNFNTNFQNNSVFNFGGNNTGFSFGNTITNFNPQYQCRECRITGSDGFRCSSDQLHIACFACSQLMPSRSIQNRPQKCPYCNNSFCEKYFGTCYGPNESGHFRPLNQHQMSLIPMSCFKGNQYEKEILLNYMASKSMSTNTLFRRICTGIDNNEWSMSNLNLNFIF